MTWLLAGAAAILWTASVPGFDWSFLAPLALAPLLAALARETRPRLRFLLGWLCGAAYWWVVCFWIEYVLENHGGMDLPVAWLAFLLFGLYKGLHTAVFALLVDARRTSWWAPLAVAFLWVGIERTHGWFGFAWVPLGGAAVDWPVLMRLAPVVGVYGLSFLFALSGAVLAAAILQRSARPLALLGLWIVPVFLPALPAASHADREAVVVQPAMPESAEWTRDFLDERLGRLAFHSFRTANGHPGKLILWPEMPGPVYFEADPAFHDLALQIATRTEDAFLFGTTMRDEQRRPYNSAILLDARGGVVGRYDKINLVPFGEFLPPAFSWVNKITQESGDFVPGSQLTLFPMEGGATKAGVFICYESAFPDYVRQFAGNGANVLFNLSNDGYFGRSRAREQHLSLVKMRAAENRRWIVRSTNNGITAVVDPAGRVAERMPEWQETAQILHYGIERETTFYSRNGDWFAWLCLAAGLYWPIRNLIFVPSAPPR